MANYVQIETSDGEFSYLTPPFLTTHVTLAESDETKVYVFLFFRNFWLFVVSTISVLHTLFRASVCAGCLHPENDSLLRPHIPQRKGRGGFFTGSLEPSLAFVFRRAHSNGSFSFNGPSFLPHPRRPSGAPRFLLARDRRSALCVCAWLVGFGAQKSPVCGIPNNTES